MNYRQEIDGLRAFAVFSVLIFHLDKKILPGGFLGVDIFFVISGYLIASIIIKRLENNDFDLTSFIQRRIARIFPLFFLVISCTLIAASYIYEEQDFASSGANSLASTLSLANIKLLFQGDYFQISEDAQPFLHYWSLSLEEQFYITFPPLIIFLFRKTKHSKNIILLIVFTISLLSFIFCIKLSFTNSTFAFYLLPSRSWELLVGSIIAIGKFKIKSRSVYYSIQFFGLAILIISVLVITEENFPGYKSLIPVLGTAFLVTPSAGKSPVHFVLSLKPIVFIGKLSYSLYLWHWPVFFYDRLSLISI